MDKIKLRIEVKSVYECEVERKHYPDNFDNDQIINCEKESTEEDPFFVISEGENSVSVTILEG